MEVFCCSHKLDIADPGETVNQFSRCFESVKGGATERRGTLKKEGREGKCNRGRRVRMALQIFWGKITVGARSSVEEKKGMREKVYSESRGCRGKKFAVHVFRATLYSHHQFSVSPLTFHGHYSPAEAFGRGSVRRTRCRCSQLFFLLTPPVPFPFFFKNLFSLFSILVFLPFNRLTAIVRSNEVCAFPSRGGPFQQRDRCFIL